MHQQEIEKLQQQYTDQYVMVDATQGALARFAGLAGQIKTVNMSGRALVQFDWADVGWHDIPLAKKAVPAKKAEE